MTQGELARVCGLSKATVQFCEWGRRRPGEKTIAALAQGLGVPTEYLTDEGMKWRAEWRIRPITTGHFIRGRLKSARERRGMTTGELGRRIGLRNGIVRQYETGERKPLPHTIAKLAQALDIPEEYLTNRAIEWSTEWTIEEAAQGRLVKERLKRARRERKLSQKGLEALTGVSGGNISRYEKGTKRPKQETVARLARGLCVPEEFLTRREDNGWMCAQPCWTCGHIGDYSCRWAWEMEPVKGWRTREKLVTDGTQMQRRLIIDYCPNYEAEKGGPWRD